MHALRLRCRLEQRLALRDRHDVVALTVEDEERGAQFPDAARGRVGIRDEGSRDERVVPAADVANARECR